MDKDVTEEMLAELESKAQVATKGPWGRDGYFVCPARTEDGTTYIESWRPTAEARSVENARFIAASNPATVLALIDAIRQQRADDASTTGNKYRAELYDEAWEKARSMGYGNVTDALVELERLRAAPETNAPWPDEIHQMAFEEGQPAEDGDGYLFTIEEFDLFVERLLTRYAAPSHKAQEGAGHE